MKAYRVDKKSVIFLKSPTKKKILRSEDLLNRGLSYTSFK